MVIKIDENQYRSYVTGTNEGVEYTRNNNGGVNFHINTDQTDIMNSKTNNVDTRVFGTKRNVLYGDVTKPKRSHSLSQSYNSRAVMREFLESVIEACKKKDFSLIKWNNDIPFQTANSVKDWIENFNDGDNNYTFDEIARKASVALDRVNVDNEVITNTYDRAMSAQNDNDKIARYNVMTVPGTNVKCIALFTMGDFNFSDAIKNGTLRQNGTTDNILGINSKEREKIGRKLKKIPTTYDADTETGENGVLPDIASNFSLKNVKDGHFKSQYGYNGQDIGQGKKTSITTFLEKSVLYADYALKQEHFRPDIIISAPSSSKFNDYYCTNLSNKLGIPYMKDFFVRNVVNVKFADGDTSKMLDAGFTQNDVINFELNVKNIAYQEISYIVCKPLHKFVKENIATLDGISLQKSDRNKATEYEIYQTLANYAFKILKQQTNKPIDKEIVISFLKNNTVKTSSSNYDTSWIMGQIDKRLRLTGRNRTFINALIEMQEILQGYSEQIETGYKPNFNADRFKITQFEKRFRPYLHDVYIIADRNFNKNGELFNRLKTSKFCIFDEDINSGATLKLVIDVLKSKIEDSNQNNIICLANAYSNSGR